jgi:hypothetical protein
VLLCVTHRGSGHDLGEGLLPDVADWHPAGEDARPHVPVCCDGDLAASTVAAQLRHIGLLVAHTAPNLTQAVD